MSMVERILFSNGCCSTPVDVNHSEIWLALILGVSISALFMGWRNIISRNNGTKKLNSSESIHVHSSVSDDDDDTSSMMFEVASSMSLIPDNLHVDTNSQNSNLNLPRAQKAVMEFLKPSRSSTHEIIYKHVSSNSLFVGDLTSRPWWDQHHLKSYPTLSDDINQLQSNAYKIFKEFTIINDQFMNSDTSGWSVNDIGKTRVFHLMKNGCKITNNCEKCPDTSAIIDQLMNVMDNSIYGQACFSVMEPGSSYDTHRGPTNIRLRSHLGLNIPNEECYLSINNEKITWEKNRCLVYEDFQPHYSKNHSNTHQSIFIVDFWHPDLNNCEIEYLTRCFPSRS